MRIWAIHPSYLDSKGLVAAWREGLLAQKVLEGKTKGYKNHPQLCRFIKSENSLMLISKYLSKLYDEAKNRTYKFDVSKIKYLRADYKETIKVTNKQIEYEFALLKSKLEKRDKMKYYSLKDVKDPKINEIFEKIEGNIEYWEKPKQEILNRIKYKD